VVRLTRDLLLYEKGVEDRSTRPVIVGGVGGGYLPRDLLSTGC
jgi:hypothetical protein